MNVDVQVDCSRLRWWWSVEELWFTTAISQLRALYAGRKPDQAVEMEHPLYHSKADLDFRSVFVASREESNDIGFMVAVVKNRNENDGLWYAYGFLRPFVVKPQADLLSILPPMAHKYSYEAKFRSRVWFQHLIKQAGAV